MFGMFKITDDYFMRLIENNLISFIPMNQNPNTQNIKFKVKEFEWFEMETKVRQIIQEVLGALQKRIMQSSSIINKLKFNQGESEKKIEQLTLMIENDPKVFETGIFASVDRRFQQQEKKIEELSRQIDEENKYVDQKFKILDIRMQESSEVLQNVASLRQRVSKQIEIQNENINTVRMNIEQMITDLNADIRLTRKQQQDNLESCEKADYALSQKIDKNTEQIERLIEKVDNHKQMLNSNAMKLEHIAQNLKRQDESIENLQESKALTKKLQYYVKDLENELKKIEFKLEAVSPLVTEAQISDCLYNVLPNKMKKKIAIHEYKKYYKLNREVLEKQYADVQSKFKGLQLLEEMQKRNTKEIVQLKRKKLQSMGIDVDNLTYQQREKYYADLVLEDNVNDDDEEVKVTAKADEKEILAIMNKHFSDFVANIKQKVNIELDDSKKYLYGIEQEIKHEVSTFEGKLKGLRDQFTVTHSDQLLENKAFSSELLEVNKALQINEQEHAKINEIQKSFYNFCSLVNHLQIQDQIDKQNISLMGVSQNNSEEMPSNKGKNSIVELDKKCFSCCGFPASTLSAFKMACLAYNPSSIMIDAREYRREELLGITTNLLQKIKKNFVQSEKVISSNMNESQGEINQENSETEQKIDFAKEETSSRNNDLEVETSAKKMSTGVKFRKTKKLMGNSCSKYYQSKSNSKNSTGLKQQLMTTAILFNQLKKRNISFLN